MNTTFMVTTSFWPDARKSAAKVLYVMQNMPIIFMVYSKAPDGYA